MRVGRRALGWGVFFIVVGSVSLGARAGWLDAPTLANVGHLWPLILVAIGIGLILERSALAVLGTVLVAAIFGLLVGGALAAGPGFGLGCVGGGGAPDGFPTGTRSGSFAGTTADVRLHLSCGDLTVTTVAGNDWAVAAWSDRFEVNSGPDSLDLTTTSGTFFLPPGRSAVRAGVTVPTAPTVALSLTLDAGNLDADLSGAVFSTVSGTLNAGNGRIDLSAARADALTMTINAGDLTLWLPGSTTQADLTVNAGKVAVCVPDGVGLRVTSTEVLASTTFGPGFSKQADAWVSADWATATQRADVRMTINVGSATVGTGGCR
jgi:hypothetical protein